MPVLSISLGATICNKDGEFDLAAIRSIANQLKELVSSKNQYTIVAVVGAGGACRKHRVHMRKYSRNPLHLDEVGIEASRLNALLLIAALRTLRVPTNSRPFESIQELQAYFAHEEDKETSARIAVLGGLEPSMTSDSTAAKLAKIMKCSLLIVSTKGGVYDKDPERGGRRMLRSINRAFLEDLVASMPESHVFDPQTCSILLSINTREMKGIYFGVTGYEHISKIRYLAGSMTTRHWFTQIFI